VANEEVARRDAEDRRLWRGRAGDGGGRHPRGRARAAAVRSRPAADVRARPLRIV